eukprot:Phypoly_transcript_20099.p1 GENE.Phypoly_transcript_20099~~Phypoly_transcript_20099.p1  ORF type:complete len:142 (+),score=11.57 Phypoly_transcript_20099:170-595(+)
MFITENPSHTWMFNSNGCKASPLEAFLSVSFKITRKATPCLQFKRSIHTGQELFVHGNDDILTGEIPQKMRMTITDADGTSLIYKSTQVRAPVGDQLMILFRPTTKANFYFVIEVPFNVVNKRHYFTSGEIILQKKFLKCI